MSLFFGSLKRISFSGKIILPVKAGQAFGHIHLLFHQQLLQIVLSHAQPSTNSCGVFCSSPWLRARAPGPSTSSGFPGGNMPHVNHTVGSSHKRQSVINALLLTTVLMRSCRGLERNEHGAPSPLSSPEGLYLFYGQGTTSAPRAVCQSQLPQC